MKEKRIKRNNDVQFEDEGIEGDKTITEGNMKM
jgi:hypothetical protein